MTLKEILLIREEIVLNSLFTRDYENSFGYNAQDIQNYFDGYLEYLYEIMEEYGYHDGDFRDFDNPARLTDYYDISDANLIRKEE